MDPIAALPCGFAHAVPSAVKKAAEARKPVLRALGDDALKEAKERWEADILQSFVDDRRVPK